VAYYYSVYGLTVRLSHPIDLLAPRALENYDVRVDLSNEAVPLNRHELNASVNTDHQNGIEVIDTQDWLIVAFLKSSGEKLYFYVRKDGTEVVSEKPPSIPNSDVHSFLLGPVLGCVMRLRKKVCIHASVLEDKGKAFAFVGHKGAGKSTTAASLLQAGASLVSDDIAILNPDSAPHPIVSSGYPGIRLRPNVLSLFDLDPNNFKQVISGDSKCYVPVESDGCTSAWNFKTSPSPLFKIYILPPRNQDINALEMTRLSKQQAVMSLVPHSYARRVLNKNQRAQEFQFISRLSQQIPVTTLDRPDDLQQLPDIAAAILADVHNES